MRRAPKRGGRAGGRAASSAGARGSGAETPGAGGGRKSGASCRALLGDEGIGRFPAASLPPNARTRLVFDQPSYRGYELLLDVGPDVFSYGILLVPKGIREGERRPVVVCQHGLEGRPQDVADPSVNNPAYNQFARQLAERGVGAFSP